MPDHRNDGHRIWALAYDDGSLHSSTTYLNEQHAQTSREMFQRYETRDLKVVSWPLAEDTMVVDWDAVD